MSKKAKKSKVVTSEDFLKMVIEELSLKPDDYFMIGHGAHLSDENPFAQCKATRATLVSYMVVDAATFVFLTMHKGLKSFIINGYEMATLPGPGANGQGGVTFVVASNGLSFLHNPPSVTYEFLKSLISFKGYYEGSVSINLFAYLASGMYYKDKFFKEFDYEKVKSYLWRQSNLGRVLFTEPSVVFEGIALVNKTREVPDWDEYRNVTNKLYEAALDRQETDEDVLEYHRLASNPNFMTPAAIAKEAEPILQETFEPDETIVAPYDPNL